jgi:hypothetical protein
LLGKSAGLKTRDSIFRGQRIAYFKGKRAVEALLKESYPDKNRPKITSQSEVRTTTQINQLNKLLTDVTTLNRPLKC